MHIGRTSIAAAAAYIYWSGIHSVVYKNQTNLFGESYGGHFQFLTILGVSVSLAQAVVSFVGEVSGLYILQVLADNLLQVSAPLELLISILYWGIRLYDVNLLLDPRIKIVLPPTVDRQIHLWPAILQTLAVTAGIRQWRDGLIGPLIKFATLTVAYWYWIEKTYSHNGFYPYPLLSVVSTSTRAMIFAAAALIVLVCYKLLQRLQGLTRAQPTVGNR